MNGPKISIVMPSYNQSAYIKDAIESVLSQSYDNKEVIIIDGGSTDGAVDVIKSYDDQIAYWVSEPDKGQSNALNKGFRVATGELVAWLNTDDVLFPRCLQVVAERYDATKADIITTDMMWMNTEGQIKRCSSVPRQREFFFWRGVWHAPPPCIFFSRALFDKIGGLDTSFHLSMDVDMWFRMMAHHPRIEHINEYLGGFRLHEASKSVMAGKKERPAGVNEETLAIHTRYGITIRQRKSWRTIYKIWQIFRLGYLKGRLDLKKFGNRHWQDVAGTLAESR